MNSYFWFKSFPTLASSGSIDAREGNRNEKVPCILNVTNRSSSPVRQPDRFFEQNIAKRDKIFWKIQRSYELVLHIIGVQKFCSFDVDEWESWLVHSCRTMLYKKWSWLYISTFILKEKWASVLPLSYRMEYNLLSI